MFEELGRGFMITLFKDSHEKVVEKVVENISRNQMLIIELLDKNKNITANEIALQIGISHRKVQENMAKLKEIGIIKRIGPAKGGHWQVVKGI